MLRLRASLIFPPLRRIAVPLLALLACLALRSDASLGAPSGFYEMRSQPSRLAHMPRITLWAWERREDLRSLDPKTFAVAYLDQTITLDAIVHTQPRRDPVAFPAAIARIPVVRIEAPRYAVLTDAQRDRAVEAILASAREPNIAALQLDFDAMRSQRAFYRSLLIDLHRRLPASLPLSITALASWCADDDWLHALPIDEVVPMLFRMEPHTSPGYRPTRNERQAYVNAYPIREPLCQASIGLSTTEPWPTRLAGKRIYLFPDHGWRRELLAELPRRLE